MAPENRNLIIASHTKGRERVYIVWLRMRQRGMKEEATGRYISGTMPPSSAMAGL